MSDRDIEKMGNPDTDFDKHVEDLREEVKFLTAKHDTLKGVLELTEQARDAAVAKVAQLQKVVDRLPKTADGVPFSPGMKVFIYNHPGIYESRIPPNRMEVDHSAFSTREAAEAARSSFTSHSTRCPCCLEPTKPDLRNCGHAWHKEPA